ncbi:MAG: tetraacyldisaccharide 4'-kinase [Puniceicoccales bacterium]|nr:tetraacyldisaccharide 4'-kinase [Puniceicoccales bacterium]
MFSRFLHAARIYRDHFVQFTAEVIYDRAESTPATRFYAAVLKGFSLFFGAGVSIRTFLYEHKLLMSDTPLGCKVVVIGNITVGGTGKTPIAEKMARVLSERGRKVVILSRGYKSRSESPWHKFKRWCAHTDTPVPRVVSDGKTLLLDSDEAGDEPYMLARNLCPLGVVVIVHRNRVEAGAYALKKFGCDTILLDDGLQYLALRGQINLLLIDKKNPFGNGSLLPRGILREPIANLRRGTYIFLTKSDGTANPELMALIKKNNPGVGVIECAHRPRVLSTLDTLAMLPLEHLRGKRVATFSGIATPESFEEMVRTHGAHVLYNKRFLDHHRFSEEELVDVFDEAAESDAELVVTTEKDAVRMDPSRKWRLPVYFLRMEIEILSGKDVFNAAVARICEGMAAPAQAAPPETEK